jgi:hypothetical protein
MRVSGKNESLSLHFSRLGYGPNNGNAPYRKLTEVFAQRRDFLSQFPMGTIK